MITKEVAAKIHNAYTEIEQGTKMIEELKKHLDKRVPFTLAALDVLTLHIENQKKELERLKEVCRIQLA